MIAELPAERPLWDGVWGLREERPVAGARGEAACRDEASNAARVFSVKQYLSGAPGVAAPLQSFRSHWEPADTLVPTQQEGAPQGGGHLCGPALGARHMGCVTQAPVR